MRYAAFLAALATVSVMTLTTTAVAAAPTGGVAITPAATGGVAVASAPARHTKTLACIGTQVYMQYTPFTGESTGLLATVDRLMTFNVAAKHACRFRNMIAGSAVLLFVGSPGYPSPPPKTVSDGPVPLMWLVAEPAVRQVFPPPGSNHDG